MKIFVCLILRLFAVRRHFKTEERTLASRTSQTSRRLSHPPTASQTEEGWVLPCDGRHPIRWSGRTLVMGILNLTPDSFSDGGRYRRPEAALDRALQMQDEGADVIDVGGETTRPGASRVSAAEEKRRVIPVLRILSKHVKIHLSIDTYKASVAEAAVGEGVRILNDIGALRLDPRMPQTVARLKVPVVLMHMKGLPGTMQKNPHYSDVVGDIMAFFNERLRAAEHSGIDPRNVILDPGFGFGKTPAHNLELTRRLGEFRAVKRPLLFAASRKSTLGLLLGGRPPEERLEASLAVGVAAVLAGADILRVHDVKETLRAIRIADALRFSGVSELG
jgi:dihydropteroate synthase